MDNLINRQTLSSEYYL